MQESKGWTCRWFAREPARTSSREVGLIARFLSLLLLCVVPLSGAATKSVDVAYANGEISLAAELLLPETKGPFPAVVVIQGSGESDRGNRWARAIANAFVANGVAALLTDKRGSGKSGGNWRTAGFDELADDALAGVRLLRGRPEIDRARIGLVGLSQGGRIAPIAASKSPEVAFVVSLVSDAVTFPEQSFVEMANTARQLKLPPADVEKVVALNAAAGRFLMGGSWDEYARMRRDMLQGPAGKIAAGFPAVHDAPAWTFLRKVMTFDPLPYWMIIHQPALLIFGEQDEADNVPVAESVRRLNFAFAAARKGNAQISVLPGLGHSLMSVEGQLAPSFVATLTEWLSRHVDSG